MAVNFNVVLLFGPPFSGKSRHYLKKYVPAGFERICPAELFLTNPDLGLRDISIQVTRCLEKGKKIVIDNENSSVKTRKSYISFIRRKFPKCKFQLVKLCPSYGYLQCMWSREFVLAPGCDQQGICKDHHIAKWYDLDTPDSASFSNVNVDEPDPSEGFSIDDQESFLTAVTPFKFEVSALFLQWEGIPSQNDLHLVDRITRICKEWEAVNPCGRIFIICDGRNVSKGLLTAHNEETLVQTFTIQLVSQLRVPVYVFEIQQAADAGRFCIPPQPGILAYLQKRHCLDLHCGTTLYLYASSSHKNMAENAGVRHIKFGRVLQHPKLVVTRHAAETPNIPPMLKALVLESDGNDVTAQIPLYNIIAEFRNNVRQELPLGRCEFLFAKDLDTIERFQDLYSANATPISEKDSRIEKLRSGLAVKTTFQSSTLHDGQTYPERASPRDLPKWMLGKTKSGTVPSLEKSVSTSSTEGKSRKRTTVYLMTEKELVESAKELLKQAGREDILEKIENDKKNKKESETRKQEPVNEDSDLESISTLVQETATHQNSNILVQMTEQNKVEKEEVKMTRERCVDESAGKTTMKRTHEDCDVNLITPVFSNETQTSSEVVKMDGKEENTKDRLQACSEVRPRAVCSNMEDISAMLDSLFDDPVQPQRKESVVVKKPRLDFWKEDDKT